MREDWTAQGAPAALETVTEMMRRLTTAVTREEARQIEEFAREYVGLAGTHDLAFYPAVGGFKDRLFWREQRIALLPNAQPNEAWPWERVIAEGLPHRAVRIAWEDISVGEASS